MRRLDLPLPHQVEQGLRRLGTCIDLYSEHFPDPDPTGPDPCGLRRPLVGSVGVDEEQLTQRLGGHEPTATDGAGPPDGLISLDRAVDGRHFGKPPDRD